MKNLQCTHIKADGTRCKNHRNAHPLTDPSTFTCEVHGNIRHVQSTLPTQTGGRITQAWLNKTPSKPNDKEDTNVTTDLYDEDNYIIAGTGSRSLQTKPTEVKKEAMRRIKEFLTKAKEEHGDHLVVVSGMAEGFDKALAKAALDLGIRLWCCVPTRGYGAYYWGRNSLTGQPCYNEFKEITDSAERVEYTTEHYGFSDRSLYGNIATGENSKFRGRGLSHMNFIRNSRMVELADEFVVWDPSSSGTAHCLAEIKKAGTPYTILS